MSLFRALIFMPFAVPAIAVAGLAYVADSALHDRVHAAPEDTSETTTYHHIRRSEHADRQAEVGLVTRSDCRAIDGDTLRCGPIRVRLLGIDAAELPGHCAVGRDCASGNPFAQKRAMVDLMSGALTIDTVATDRWGRNVADVTTSNGTDLSCAMLAAGATYKPKWDNGYRIARTCPSRTEMGFRRKSDI